LRCPSCQTEQNDDNRFCRSCGSPLTGSDSVEQNQSDSSHPASPKVRRKRQVEWPSFKLDVRWVKVALIMGVSAFILVLALSFGLSYALNFLDRSNLMVNLAYSIFENALSIPVQQTVYFINEVHLEFWELLLLIHGGSLHGTLGKVSTLGNITALKDFNLYFPVFFFTFLGGLIIFAVSRITHTFSREKGLTLTSKILCLFIGGLIYSILISILLWITSLSIEYSLETPNLILSLKANITATMVRSFFLFIAMGGIGFGASLKPIKQVLIYLTLFLVLIGGLMFTSWHLSNPKSNSMAQTNTMQQVWKDNLKDPAFYILYPNFLLQEQLYALGGTWKASGNLAQVLSFEQPVELNIIKGGPFLSLVDSEVVAYEQFENQVKFTWHPYALVLGVLFALSRGKIHLDIRTFVTSMFLILLGTVAIIEFTTIRLKINLNNQASAVDSGIIGFSLLQATIAVFIVCTVFALIASALRVFKQRRVVP